MKLPIEDLFPTVVSGCEKALLGVHLVSMKVNKKTTEVNIEKDPIEQTKAQIQGACICDKKGKVLGVLELSYAEQLKVIQKECPKIDIQCYVTESRYVKDPNFEVTIGFFGTNQEYRRVIEELTGILLTTKNIFPKNFFDVRKHVTVNVSNVAALIGKHSSKNQTFEKAVENIWKDKKNLFSDFRSVAETVPNRTSPVEDLKEIKVVYPKIKDEIYDAVDAIVDGTSTVEEECEKVLNKVPSKKRKRVETALKEEIHKRIGTDMEEKSLEQYAKKKKITIQCTSTLILEDVYSSSFLNGKRPLLTLVGKADAKTDDAIIEHKQRIQRK